MITGLRASRAASSTPLIEDELVTLTAGSAKACSLQYASSFIRLAPVTTPAGTSSCSPRGAGAANADDIPLPLHGDSGLAPASALREPRASS